MAHARGTQMGRYELLEPLDAGGMGEVYRAHDPLLNRPVAVKVLRAERWSEEDAQRLEREARALSRLNHPNILTIHDVGLEKGASYIVSELLEGQTLRDLLNRGSIPLRRLVDIAVQVSGGLAAAHAEGFTHRDMKPENIFIVKDGRAKILDFGLARPVRARGEREETWTNVIASAAITGTAAYMSPEQALGKDVDFRSDQFSFGVVLYEMASGRHPFRGENLASTLDAVVNREATPVGNVNPAVPVPLRWTIERCLAKEPSGRYASTLDLHEHLCDLQAHLTDVIAGEAKRARRWRSTWLRRLAFLLIGTACVAAGVVGTALLRPTPHSVPYDFTPFATEAADEVQPAWSPDGQTLAYVISLRDVQQVFARSLDSVVPVQLTSAADDCSHPFWSADGTQIYYWSKNAIWRVAAAGGAAQEVIQDVAPATHPATISPDGKTLAFFRAEGPQLRVFLQTLPGGPAVALERPPFPASFRLAGTVKFSPNGSKLLVAVVPDITIESGADLWLIPMSADQPRHIPLELTGGYRVIEFSWTPDNRNVVFSTALRPGGGRHLHLLDTETGKMSPVTSGVAEEREPDVSPDGRRIAFVTGGTDVDLYEISLDGKSVAPLLVTARQEHSPNWAPSGTQFVYVSDASGVPEIWLRSNTEEWARPLVRASAEGTLLWARPRISPDGRRLAYLRIGVKHLILISSLSGGPAVPLEQESSDQHSPAWSPDGTWIAYTRYIGQRWEIAKAPYGGGGSPVRLCAGGGAQTSVEWSASGDWICFLDSEGVHAVPAGGGEPHQLHGPAAAITLSRDGSEAYVVRRSHRRAWEMIPIRVRDGTAGKPLALNVPPESSIRSLGLNPDGKRFVVSLEFVKRDIWILDGFAKH